ncbi:hypothetical protein Mgra_00000755 [Meloidogyne graminicola]|uniref:Uncharacterized protein n=1 Tax=Meloidogyne graminicola TaxID=189291 RepID=A0A8T0A354_9BILA|nr:hypothetical protein Mgra_00000755 [Meloidogyne graminicola]
MTSRFQVSSVNKEVSFVPNIDNEDNFPLNECPPRSTTIAMKTPDVQIRIFNVDSQPIQE